jgi:hypothetical protein
VLATSLFIVTEFVAVTPAGAAQPPAKFLGPIISYAENPNVTLGRDGGFSVPLPNGRRTVCAPRGQDEHRYSDGFVRRLGGLDHSANVTVRARSVTRM